MHKKNKTTYDEFMDSLSISEKEKFESEYKEFLISEMILAAMEEDAISVRKLAKEAGVSPSIIQGVRSGLNKNLTIKSLVKILKALGFSLVAEKNGQKILIDITTNKN